MDLCFSSLNRNFVQSLSSWFPLHLGQILAEVCYSFVLVLGTLGDLGSLGGLGSSGFRWGSKPS